MHELIGHIRGEINAEGTMFALFLGRSIGLTAAIPSLASNRQGPTI